MQIIRARLNSLALPGEVYLYGLVLCICIGSLACEDKVTKDSSTQPLSDASMLLSSLKKVDKAELDPQKLGAVENGDASKSVSNDALSNGEADLEQADLKKVESQTKSDQLQKPLKTETHLPKPKNIKKKPKKPSKCRRGIHKGRKLCTIERGHISLYHINRGKRHKSLRLIDDQRRVISEAREIMLEFLSDWRSKKKCKKGFSFNYEYKGRASWKMYDCYVQDRLLWYLYLIGHHFDSEIQIVSGLRAHERKTSRHHNGHAVDFRVKGVKAKEVWEYSKKTFPLVGIGYYPKTKFVHLDVGRDHHQAFWVDSSGSGESASYRAGVSQVQRGRAKKSQSGMISSIKRSLKRHYKSFKAKQKAYLKRKKRRLERKKKRAARAKRRKRARKRKKK